MSLDNVSAHKGGTERLPERWERKKLGEICKVIAGQSPEGTFYNSEGNGMPFYQGKKEYGVKYIGEPTTWTTKITKEAEAGDILISVRAPVGPVNFATQKICIGRGLAAIRAGKNIDKEFLFNYLIKYESEIEGNVGAVFNSINKTQIESLEIPLPPLPEQQRIVSILDECFAAIDQAKANAEQNLKNTRALFESYLQGVFDPSTRSGQGKGDGWELTSLRNEIKLVVGFAFKSKGYTQSKDDILLVRGDNIMQGYFRWKDAKRWKKSEYTDYEKYQLKKNDIVLAMDRPWVKAGLKIARITEFELPALLVQRTACLRSKDKLEHSFLYHLLNSRRFMQYLIDAQTGIGVPHISGQQILDFEFRKPPLQQQQAIVRQLDALRAETQKLEAVYQKKIADLDELKKSILQKAFAGELRGSEPVESKTKKR